MDFTFIAISIGFIFTGFVIAYPFGYYLGRRSAWLEFDDNLGLCDPPEIVAKARKRLEDRDILNAQIIEVKNGR